MCAIPHSATAADPARPDADRWLWCLAISAAVLGSLALTKFMELNSIDACLQRAAVSAVQEAAAPRASRTSITIAAQRSLARDGCGAVCSNLDLRINDRRATSRWIDCGSGDTISVTLTAAPPCLIADLSRLLGIGLEHSLITTTAMVKRP
ncbi:MAG TPA: hypothetical protein VHX65_06725 [Pirellulales bacterium]|nr:hypothetical protein [Pirellulales bacterium]